MALGTRQGVHRKPKGLLLLPLILCLTFSGLSLNHSMPPSATGSALGFARARHATLPMAPIASVYPYDEQVGVTFTQDFSVLAFNVTAVPFTNADGVGPGYLVNGLTDRGYWYQVGLSYNWPFKFGGVNSGFRMIYEVFDSSGASVDPVNGGGLQDFNGQINPGDVVLLSLSFSSRSVVMQAIDWQTGAASSHSFASIGSRFIGLPYNLSSPLGFFTGLMTEQDHSAPYYGSGVPVSYNETGVNLSPAWMWIDEWNTDTNQSVFSDNTASPVPLNSSLSQYFSSNGIAEVASAYGLVTGLTPGLGPVSFPTLDAGPLTTGPTGHQVSVPIVIADREGATVRISNLTIATSFGRFNFSLGISFSLGTGTTQQNVTIIVPSGQRPGIYSLTVDLWSWQYLDTQAQKWIPLRPITVNETLVLTGNPPPTTNPRANPPGSGQGPSTSTNKTTTSPASLLGLVRIIIIPVAAGYGALGLLAVALLIRQERKRTTTQPIQTLRFCQSCGSEMGHWELICPRCGHSTMALTSSENQSSANPNPS